MMPNHHQLRPLAVNDAKSLRITTREGGGAGEEGGGEMSTDDCPLMTSVSPLPWWMAAIVDVLLPIDDFRFSAALVYGCNR